MPRQTSTPDAPNARANTATRRWLLPALLVVVWLALAGVLGPMAGQLGEEAEGSSAAGLPDSAESSEVLRLNEEIVGYEALPAVVVYTGAGELTESDLAAISDDMDAIESELGDALADSPIGPILAEDSQAAQVVVPLHDTHYQEIGPQVEQIRALLDHDGLDSHVTGPAGASADLDGALGGINVLLLIVTVVVILVILFTVYRSPALPFLVLVAACTALGVAMGSIYLLSRADLISMGPEVQGIFSVLVLGIGTDYALLIVARYRQELRRHQDPMVAITRAWKSSVGPILASAGTVILGLLCLLASDLGMNRDLGPGGAIGIACTAALMLTFLPAVLLLCGRGVFWPARPLYGSAPPERSGMWQWVANRVGRRPRLVWIGTVVVLAIMAVGLVRFDAGILTEGETVLADDTDSSIGQDVLSDHFPPGAGTPATIMAEADHADTVVRAAERVEGVDSAATYTGDTAGEQDPPRTSDGLVRVDATLASAPDGDEARETVERLRDRMAELPEANALVGGFTAITVDFDESAESDSVLVMPMVLIMVLIVLAVLLRALVAPLILVAATVLSYLAAIGVSVVVFEYVFGFPRVDATFPLHTFVFLVALSVDYSIFLMTRVREETRVVGTRQGTLNALVLTGGVITSAGVVLAATFSALAVMPLILMIQLAFTVALGLLLDTFVVRAALVPALTVDLGSRVWWPSRLDRRESLPREPHTTEADNAVAAPRPESVGSDAEGAR